jgi:uncharacterized membrane protein YjjP (DUF1212 family)
VPERDIVGHEDDEHAPDEPEPDETHEPDEPFSTDVAIEPLLDPDSVTDGFIEDAQRDTVELVAPAALINRVGRLALSAGHGSYRVKNHMERVGSAIGLDAVRSSVSLTEIITTAWRGAMYRTTVTENRVTGINADRLAELEHYVGGLPEQADMVDISDELDRIEAKPPLYPAWGNALAAGVACAAFAFLNHGGPVECVGVLIAATVGQGIRHRMIRRGINQFGVTMLSAAVACSLYLLLVAFLGLFMANPAQHAAGYVAAILYLVPGFPLVTGALDLARLDLTAGISRLTFALMILGTSALSLWGVSQIVGLEPDPMQQTAGLPPELYWTLIAVASFVGVAGFAIMFNSPWHASFIAATIGMIANTARLWSVDELNIPTQAAAAGAALIVGLMARSIATPAGVPRLVVSVPAVVIMVPGVMAYRGVFALNAGDFGEGLAFAVQAFLAVGGLAVGLAMARFFTDHEWTFED